MRLRVIYGLFCARHELALFVRSTDRTARDFAFIKKHQRCRPLVAVGRWLTTS